MGEDFDHSTNNEFDNLDQQRAYNQLQERINAFMHCQRRYQRQSVTVCVVTLNYGECDTPTRNCDAPVKEKATWVGQWRENLQFCAWRQFLCTWAHVGMTDYFVGLFEWEMRETKKLLQQLIPLWNERTAVLIWLSPPPPRPKIDYFEKTIQMEFFF